MVADTGRSTHVDARYEMGACVSLEGHLYEVVRYERSSMPLGDKLWVRDCRYDCDDPDVPVIFFAHQRASMTKLVRPAPTIAVADAPPDYPNPA